MTRPFLPGEREAWDRAVSEDGRIHGDSRKMIRQLEQQISAIDNRLAEIMWMPPGHPSRAQLGPLTTERASLVAQRDANVTSHTADVATRSAASRAAAALRDSLVQQLARVERQLETVGYMPARHPSRATETTLRAQHDALIAQINGLEIPPYDYPS
jgi:hypothetical protein